MADKHTSNDPKKKTAAIEELSVHLQRTEEALRESEERLKTILDAIQVGVVVVDQGSGTIVDANDVAVDMIGVSKTEIVGSVHRDFICPSAENDENVSDHRQQLNGSELVLMRSDGKRVPILRTAVSVKLGGKDHLLESFMDVSRQKQAERELKKANQKILEQRKAAIEEERLKVLLQMAGATAHELNQPLTALLGNIELLKMDQRDPEKLFHHIVNIEEAGRRISDITKEIQDIRQCETGLPTVGSSILELEEALNILSIEDSDADFEKIRDILKERKIINLFRATGIEEAIDLMARVDFDIIFMEHVLPDGDGLDFMRRNRKKDLEIPVVVITGQGNEMIASQVIQNGAYDYLPKDLVTRESLTRSIGKALKKFRLKKAITMAQKKMAEMSTKDALTGLYNRRYFTEALERELARANRYRSEVVLCMLDLDHFKTVNDTYGHPAGDAVLSELGGMLKEYIRESDLLCRYGGEEFAIILTNTEPEKARVVCERFREMVAWHEFSYNGFSFHVTVSIGIASYDSTSNPSVLELIELADKALYRAKNAGRNNVVECADSTKWHRPKIGNVLVSEGYITDADLGKALSEQRLRLGEILVKAGRITAQQRDHALDYQKKVSSRLGEMLRKLGHATDEDIVWALGRTKRRLGEILLEQNLVNDNELQWALAVQQYEPQPLQ
jgi:two-component system cell cycle response regulator